MTWQEEAQIVAAIERALDEAEREELGFDEPTPIERAFDDFEEAFFADGEALSAQFRAEAEAIERREAASKRTARAGTLRRMFA